MPSLCDRNLNLISEDRWGLTWHANESIQERNVEISQLVGLTPEGRLLREFPQARPRPKVEIGIVLPDGTAAKVIWAYDLSLDIAVLITVRFLDRG